MAFCDGFLALSVIVLRSICVIASINIFFLFIAKYIIV